MRMRILSRSSALLLDTELPQGITVFKTKELIPGDDPISRKKGGTTAWIGIEGQPYMCHRRHGKWFISQEASLLLAENRQTDEPASASDAPFLLTWEASASSPIGINDEELGKRFPALTAHFSD